MLLLLADHLHPATATVVIDHLDAMEAETVIALDHLDETTAIATGIEMGVEAVREDAHPDVMEVETTEKRRKRRTNPKIKKRRRNPRLLLHPVVQSP